MLDFLDFLTNAVIAILLTAVFSGCCATKIISVEYQTPPAYQTEYGTGKIAMSITSK